MIEPALDVNAVPCGDTVLVDAAQEVKPKWWPTMMRPYVVWNHIILTLADSPDGYAPCSGFTINGSDFCVINQGWSDKICVRELSLTLRAALRCDHCVEDNATAPWSGLD